MRTIFKSVPAVLVWIGCAVSGDLTGIVTDSSRHPLQGAKVFQASTGNATSSDELGAWQLLAAPSSVLPTARRLTGTFRLQLIDNHLRLIEINRDLFGRRVESEKSSQNFQPENSAPRKTEAADSIFVGWNGRIRARRSIAAGFDTIRIDTATTKADVPWNDLLPYAWMVDSRDGQRYRTIQIGSQTWMAENLNFRGIPGNRDTFGVTISSSPDSSAKYGRLYIWSDAMNRNTDYRNFVGNVQGLCPTGWHVPTEAEWGVLSDTSRTAGRKLKATRGWSMAYWYPDTAYDTTNLGTDSLGFRGLGAGVLQWNSTTDIRNIGSTGSFCSSTVHYASFPVAYDLDAASQVFSKANSAGDFGISLRCLKD